MYQVIIVIHVLLGLGVIGFVLIQQGKGADAGAAFGSSSGTVFGAQGASSFLSRTTAILAALFFATSLTLAVLSGNIEDKTDLMDAPEEVFADVPLVNGKENLSDIEALPIIKEDQPVMDALPVIKDRVPAKDALPVLKEELPAEVKKIQDEISSMADSVKTDAIKATEKLGTEVQQ